MRTNRRILFRDLSVVEERSGNFPEQLWGRYRTVCATCGDCWGLVDCSGHPAVAWGVRFSPCPTCSAPDRVGGSFIDVLSTEVTASLTAPDDTPLGRKKQIVCDLLLAYPAWLQHEFAVHRAWYSKFHA
jgi:hypothetical protein